MTSHDLDALLTSRDKLHARVTTLRAGLLSLLGDTSPASRAASDEDLLQAVARRLPTPSETATCSACGDFEAGVWRRRVELDLGDTEEVHGATHTRLRRMLSLTVQQLGTDLAEAQRERDEAVAASESVAGDLAAATDRLVSLEHALDVFAAELDAGDLDTLRLRIDEVRGDLLLEVSRG